MSRVLNLLILLFIFFSFLFFFSCSESQIDCGPSLCPVSKAKMEKYNIDETHFCSRECPDDFYDCQTAEDCVIVEKYCCNELINPMAINKKYLEEYGNWQEYECSSGPNKDYYSNHNETLCSKNTTSENDISYTLSCEYSKLSKKNICTYKVSPKE